MKRVLLLIALFSIFFVTAKTQLINSPRSLDKRIVGLGFEPAYHINGEAKGVMMNLYGAYGITDNIDLGLKYGFAANNDYMGGQMEWGISRYMTLFTGVHKYKNFGFDGGLAVIIPISSRSMIFVGGRADINFTNSVNIPLWIPIGTEIAFNEGISLILEGQIGAANGAYHALGLGFGVYL